LAVSFGQGLQMTNILKDLWDDKERGACWLPREVFRGEGFDLRGVSSPKHTGAFEAGLSDLIGLAHAHLKNALSYTLLIPQREKGIRKFCLWAIGMAILTLRKINKRRDYTSGSEVKISRRTVKAIILVTSVTLGSNYLLQVLFGLAGRGLPMSRISP
jgi:farnesyl-diphosphate farnesyltransferase